MRFAAIGLGLVLALAGCAYDPGWQGAHPGAAYQANLQACRSSAAASVHTQNIKTFPSWIASPFTTPFQRIGAIRRCMQAKGYTG